MGITVHLAVAGGHTKLNNKQSVEQIGGYTVISSSLNMTTKKQLLLKRMIDICAGLTGCLMTVLLTAIVGPMINLKSPGPIFLHRSVSAKTVKGLRCTNSAVCIWMRKSEKRIDGTKSDERFHVQNGCAS